MTSNAQKVKYVYLFLSIDVCSLSPLQVIIRQLFSPKLLWEHFCRMITIQTCTWKHCTNDIDVNIKSNFEKKITCSIWKKNRFDMRIHIVHTNDKVFFIVLQNCNQVESRVFHSHFILNEFESFL